MAVRRRWGAATAALVGLVLCAVPAAAAEIGADDFRISTAGPDGSTAYSAFDADVAYNPADDLFLVVWAGEDDAAPLAVNELEIFGRLVGRDGTPLGSQFRISDMGPDGDTGYYANSPSVAYNAVDNEFLVVWVGNDITEPDVYGQRLAGATGAHLGSNDFRVSDVGPDGSVINGAASTAVVHNPVNDQYLVVWHGDEGIGGLVDDEHEIYGQLLTAAGAETGPNDFAISDMGPIGDATYGATSPAVAFNSNTNRFLVTWSGTDDVAPLVQGEREIFGQLLLGASGAPVGADDFRISTMGPDGNSGYGAFSPATAFNPASGDFLVVWSGSDAVSGEFEIHGQRITSSGGQNGADDFVISATGPAGDPDFDAIDPDVAYNTLNDEWLVVWAGDAGGDEEYEIHTQRLRGSGVEVGADDARISTAGADGSPAYQALQPAVAHANPFLVVWHGDDTQGSLVDDELEVFGQLVETAGDTVGLVDPTQGFWRLRNQAGVETGFFFGNPGDFPIMGDWNCDGVDTVGMYRQADGFVYLRNSNTQGAGPIRFFFGNPGDIPIVGDFDGDGCDTVSIYRPAQGRAFIINELGQNNGGLGAAEFDYFFGNPGDKPFVGDFDGDGVDTIGLHRESTGFVYFRNSHTQGVADAEFFFGDPGDRLIAGDWGIVDGVDTPAVFRPADTTFYFRHTNTQGNADATSTWGQAGWLPVAGTFGLD